MPEGPEVECVRRELLLITGKKLKHITLTELSQKYPKYQGKQSQFDVFDGIKLKSIERLGKFLIWRFNTEPVVLNHLGMSGKWFLAEDISISTHPKVIIRFGEKNVANAIFDDVRNFGQFTWFPNYNAVLKSRSLKNIGIDGLEDPFDMDTFLELLDNKRNDNKPVGQVLLDQRVVAGIGNIYKSESLFHAKINPEKQVKDISLSNRISLGKSISIILHRALEHSGSTFGNHPYLLPSGESGEAQKWHSVYDKEGETCNRCAGVIKRIKQKDRSTFYCSSCQS